MNACLEHCPWAMLAAVSPESPAGWSIVFDGSGGREPGGFKPEVKAARSRIEADDFPHLRPQLVCLGNLTEVLGPCQVIFGFGLRKTVSRLQVIAVRLREAMERFRRRTGCRITYKQLSEKTGISESTLQSVAARRDYNTTLDTVDRIATALDCPLDLLLEQISEPSPRAAVSEVLEPQPMTGVSQTKKAHGPQY